MHVISSARLLGAALALSLPASAFGQGIPEDLPGPQVLFVDFGGSYTTDGVNMHAEILRLDAEAIYVRLNSSTAAEAAEAILANPGLTQIWVYDLSLVADAHTADFVAIKNWYEVESGGEAILDGRFLSSYWHGRSSGEGRIVTENYFTNLSIEGGGLVLATDHDRFANAGMNDLCALLGFNNFVGNFGGSFPVDSTNPLMNTPNLVSSLFNDSSTGQAPFGLQPNGLILDTVGFHSGNSQNPGISSTIDGSLNLAVTIEEPDDATLICPPDDTVTAVASAEGVTGDVSYTWSSSVDGDLGTGSSIELIASELTPGEHEIRVIAEDNRNIDDADITIQVGGDNCDDDGDGVINGEDQCPGFPDSLDADGDTVPDDCDSCFGFDNGADADNDGFCDDADPCFGDNLTLDVDNDGICGSDDQCLGDDASPDTDGDGICEDIDACLGDDASPDTDGDGICEDIDPCIGADNDNDSDNDGICDDQDICVGTDSTGDSDSDGICDSDDQCLGDDASPDTDGDGICEDIDQCIGNDASPDTDGDGICEDIDLCLGDDAAGDTDEDGHCDDLDCAIDNPGRYPGAPELCNGVDDDCDGEVPANESDEDGDLVRICAGDCDDSASTVYADAPERCDGLDNDCDEAVDEDFEDTNDNGVLDCAEVDTDNDGVLPFEGDCDNTDPNTYAGATELCDGLDNDCDGLVPDVERDGDGDLLSECEGDCDDTVISTYDGAPELCDDVDNDCDGDVDEDFVDSNNDGVVDCLEVDSDGDGLTPSEGDCDDDEANASPEMVELCDGIDNNCDGVLPLDEQDLDGDGVMACEGDCDDDNADIYPGATELSDGIDNNCDDILLSDEMFVSGGCECSTTGSSAPLLPLIPGLLGTLLVLRRRQGKA